MPRKLSNIISMGWNSSTVGLHGIGSVSVEAAPEELALAAITIGAIVQRTTKVEDGSLIKVLEPAWLEIGRIIRKNPNDLYQLSPEQWEELVAASYEKSGRFDEVILTPRSGDLGRDVIATKHGWGSVRIIDQVKAYKPGNLVTADDVRALSGVLHMDHHATKGIVTTTSDFAPRIMEDKLIAPLCPYRLELINGQELFRRLKGLSGET